ncbi:MAG TPA: hypothetical protein DD671_15500, partial [Balneolaceae bacterium]|nr:hypothetical protein [Balneolaceae bacterium]
IEEKELYFRVSDPMRSADFIPINLTKKSCIQTIGSKKFFVPDEITYSTKRIGPGREVTIDWGGNCTFDEFKVYWDHGSGRYSMYEYFLPMQEIFSTSENSGKVTFQNTYLSSPKIWWTVVIDGEETELTLPSYSSF